MVEVVWFTFQECLDPLPSCLWKGPLKREFSDIYFATYFGVRNFGNASALRMIFCLKIFKI